MSDFLEMHKLADGEATAAEVAALHAQLQEDPKLKTEYETVVLLKSTLQKHCVGVQDPELLKACKERIIAIDRPKRAERFVSRYALGFCGALAVLIVGAGLLQRGLNHGGSLDANEVAAMSSALSPTAIGGNLNNWLRSKVGDAPVQAPSSLQWVGGFEGESKGKRFATLTFVDQAGPVTLMIVPQTSTISGLAESYDHRYRLGVLNGSNCVCWVDGEYALFLYGQRDTIQLQSIADRMRR